MEYVEETIVEDVPMGGGFIDDGYGGMGMGGMGMGGFGGLGGFGGPSYMAPGCCCSLI